MATRTMARDRRINALGQFGERVWRAASYARLSVDDGGQGQSVSIVSQQKIIQAYADARADVEIVAEFSDDGWSGSNFERPGFKHMMKAVDVGRIDCIIVKDLSRLGRNYLDTGRYLERILPEKGVRLIAVNDGYDSLKSDTTLGLQGDDALIVPFKNLINDYYCANSSAKIKEALAARRCEGLFVGAFAPYGYVKSQADRNVLEVDPVAAPVVARMFRMRASGASFARIAAKLNDEGVLSPSALKESRGCKQAKGVAKQVADRPRWHASQVCKILRNEMYAGVLVQGKSFSPSFRSHVRLKLAPSEWERVPGACPALVDRALFEAAQQPGADAAQKPGRKPTSRSRAQAAQRSDADDVPQPVSKPAGRSRVQAAKQPGAGTARRSAAKATGRSRSQVDQQPGADTARKPGAKSAGRSRAQAVQQPDAQAVQQVTNADTRADATVDAGNGALS